MNFARIFERVYCAPVAITAEGFRAIDTVLRPRLLGKVPMPEMGQLKPHVETSSTSRKQRAKAVFSQDGKTIVDPRLYGLVAPGVAAIPIKGIMARNVSALDEICLGMAGYESIMAAIQQAAGADEVQALLLDVDSPGGECNGAFELADLIASVEKPVYGFTEGYACSAAELQMSQTAENYNTRSAYRGSIGVIAGILDDTQSLAMDGLKADYFTAGAGKAAGQSGYTLNDADRAMIQARVDYWYGLFATAVQAKRGDIAPLVEKTAAIYIGAQAVDAGLSDAVVSGFDEVVQMIVEAQG